MKSITSATNPLYKTLLSLTTSKGIKNEHLCIVSGRKLITELKKFQQEVHYLVTTNEDDELITTTDYQQLIHLPHELFNKIDICGTRAPLAVVSTLDIKKSEPNDSEDIIYCGLGDPNNLGAFLRSSVAFGFPQVVLLSEACHAFHPKTIKASSGAVFRLKLFQGGSLTSIKDTPNIYGLDMNGENIRTTKLPQPIRIVMGEEGPGLPKNHSWKTLSIPMQPNVESLNAMVASSVLLYEIFQQRES